MDKMNSDEHYKAAISLRNRVLDGKTNETPVMAWAAVCRECAKANDAKRREINSLVYTRSELAFFNNLDRVWWYAKAQVETLARRAA